MVEPRPNILLIYTGGTIGMIRDTKDGPLHAFNFKNLLDKIPELSLLDCNIQSVSLRQPIDSSNMNPKYWIDIASIIEQSYSNYDGFVVLHGSDTMSYTASALSFMFENLNKPIVFTGSQLPIGDLRTDAKENLITSIQVASLRANSKSVIQEVCLYFEYKLYRANRTTKVNAEHFEAFASPNYPELATSGVHLKVNEQYLLPRKHNKICKVHKQFDTDVAIIKMFPGITNYVIKSIFETENLRGVILETFGAGNCTTEDWFIKLISEAISKGIKIINVTQCIGGSVLMGNYETSKLLKEIGVITGKDLTIEAAITKLMFLLALDLDFNSFKIKFEKQICGEMS